MDDAAGDPGHHHSGVAGHLTDAAGQRRYRAFISYSHKDTPTVAWLHRAIETYPIPRKLIGSPTPLGPVPRRLTPIFRDRDELHASGNLGAELHAALTDALFLIVICSTVSAHSRWVGEEILAFKRVHGDDRVLALIVDGEPYDSDRPGGADLECFPAALRYRLGPDGGLSDIPAEPIAADLRRGKDGRRLAKLKLIAGLSGLRLDDLVQREAQRRAQRMTIIAGASFAGMVMAGGLALYANAQRIEAERQRMIAERETATARAASDYLIGTYKLINPATENPRSISALTLLGRGADRARVELSGQPAIHARLLQALGEAYNNLGLSKDFTAVAEQSMPAIRRAGPEGAQALLQLSSAYLIEDRSDDALKTVGLAETALGSGSGVDPFLSGEVAAQRAFVLYNRSELKRGLVAADKALANYRRVPNPPLESIAKVLSRKGLLLSDDGQFEAAESSLREALAVYRSVLGDKTLKVGQAWYALALNEQAAGNLAVADRSIRQALAIDRAVLDDSNRLLADAISAQGQIYQSEHKFDAAAATLNEAIRVYRRAFGRPNSQIGITLVYLALAESDRGHLDLALADLDEAKHNYDVGYGKLHPNHGDLLVNRATILAKYGRRGEALADCAAGIRILNQTLGADSGFTKSSAQTCAKL